MTAQDFTFTYQETLRVRLLDNGRAVLSDENGLRAMAFQYTGDHNDRDELVTHAERAIVDAMLDASLPYDPVEHQGGEDFA